MQYLYKLSHLIEKIYIKYEKRYCKIYEKQDRGY